MKRILVTGGSGFVGKHLLNRLIKDEYELSCVARRKEKSLNKRIIYLDLTTYDPVKVCLSKNYDVILHLAGSVNVNEAIKEPKKHILNNINITLNLLEDIRINNHGCLLIFASSDKVYGNADISKVNEKYKGTPAEPYGASKLISELLIQNYHLTYNLNYIIIRCGNIFGPGQAEGLFIPTVITNLIKGNNSLRLGNLEAYRNFVYVEDIADAYAKCITNKDAVNKIFNIAAYNVKIADVLEEIIKISFNFTGKKIKVIQDKQKFRVSELGGKRFILDCSKANKILNWHPQYNFNKALKKTFESYIKPTYSLGDTNIGLILRSHKSLPKNFGG